MAATGYFIPVYADIITNPKIKKLKRMLRLSQPMVIGGLVSLWSHAIQHYKDGFLPSKFIQPEEIAEFFDYQDDPQILLAALIDLEFLDLADGGMIIHNWDQYGGKYHEKIVRDKERKQRSRELRRSVNQPAQDVRVTSTEFPRTAKDFPALEEEREREEEKEKYFCPELQKANSRPDDGESANLISPDEDQEPDDKDAAEEQPVHIDSSPVILTFPVVGNTKSWNLSESMISRWCELYELDKSKVISECKKALAWIIANPGKKKTAKGMAKFLNGWLCREKEKASHPLENKYSSYRPQFNGQCQLDRENQYRMEDFLEKTHV